MHDPIVATIIFFGVFFAVISFLQFMSEKVSFPFTVSLLIFGLVAQYISHVLGFNHEIGITPSIIFYVLLPLLLFDSAIRINFHQFQLHFRTIAFLSTFGLLISIAVVGVSLFLLAGIPLSYGLLFGAVISATDPIAVVSIFKSLRAPKRLSLLAEGESMFNDATAVIVFRMLLAIVLGSSAFAGSTLLTNFGSFIYVFFGSIAFGGLLGYIGTKLISKIDNDHLTETTITVALALSAFIISEHFFHLSGVITTVMAGIIFGNIGRTAISREVVHFVDKLWEYVAFLCVSLVFFFAAYALDVTFFFESTRTLFTVILSTLVARAVSVYLSGFISNRSRFFRKEPNIPVAWQHILNWGGLRGVIPLVLVYSIPDDFAYKTDFVNFTLAAFLFTLFVNGTTIKLLLVRLKIHLPRKEEEIIREEERLFETEESRKKLRELSVSDFSESLKLQLEKKLIEEEVKHKNILLKLSNFEEFFKSIKYQSLEIERRKLDELFKKRCINENVYFMFETQLDLQMDSLEFPEVVATRGVGKGGFLPSQKRFHERMERLDRLAGKSPILARISEVPRETLVKDRLALLKTRIAASHSVLTYLKKITDIFNKNIKDQESIKLVIAEYKNYLKINTSQYKKLADEFPKERNEVEHEFISAFIAN